MPPKPQKPPFPAYAPKGDECRIRQKKEHKAILTSIKIDALAKPEKSHFYKKKYDVN